MNRARRMGRVPFFVFAHVDKFRVGIFLQANARFGDTNFLYATLGVIDDFEKAFSVFHTFAPEMCGLL
jgi:hypothetical protein